MSASPTTPTDPKTTTLTNLNDTFTVGIGDHDINGNGGNDTITVGAGNSNITVTDGNSTITAGAGDSTVIVDGDGNNTISAGAGNSTFKAGDGNNTINAGAGNSTFTAGDGNNTLGAGAGDSIVIAGLGNNTIATGAGNSTITTGDGDNTIATGAGDSNIIAGDGSNSIATGAGNSNIIAGDGGNIIATGAGINNVTSGAGDDIISTAAGNDVIKAGGGSDIVSSFAGNDVLIYVAADNMAVNTTDLYDGGAGTDTLKLVLTRDEWMRDDIQADVANYLAFIAANTGANGEDSTASFTFESFGLTANKMEALAVTVDGVDIDPNNHSVTLIDDVVTTTENESVAVDVLSNDTVPDLINGLTIKTAPLHGSVVYEPAYSNTALAPSAKFTYTPEPGHYDYLAVGESTTDKFTYEVTDATGDVSTATVIVTIAGTNDAPTATVIEGIVFNQDQGYGFINLLSTSNDVDTTDTLSVDSIVSVVTSNPDRVFDYYMAAANDSLVVDTGYFDDLSVGESEMVTVTYLITDGNGGMVENTTTFNVEGRNDAPLVFQRHVDTSEDHAAFASNLLTDGYVVDVDEGGWIYPSNGDEFTMTGVTVASDNGARTVSYASNGATGAFSMDPNQFNDLALGESETITISFNVVDPDGAVVPNTHTITIIGTNDAPVITSGAQAGAVVEDGALTASGQITSSDADNDATATYTGNMTGVYGNFAVNAASGAWTYVLDNAAANVQALAAGEEHTESFVVQVSDGLGGVADQTVNVLVTGTNDAPIITSGSQAGAVVEDGALTASGQITSSDADDATATYTGNMTGVYGNFAVNAASGAWTYVLDNAAANVQALAAGEEHTESFVVQVSDGLGGVADQTVNVLVTGTNDIGNPPVDIDDVSTDFENGFDGWLTIGSTSIESSTNGSGNMAQMNGTGASEAQIEEFFGDDISNFYEGTFGSAIMTTLSLEAGDTISFDYYFNTTDYLPYNDFSVFMGVDGNMELLSNVAMVGDYGQGEWQTMELAINVTGIYDIGFASINAIDSYLPSQLWVDNLQIVPSTNNTGGEVFNGTAGDDILTGLGGDDTLTGGLGADTFFFNPEGGNDIITDFGTGDDVIDLSAFTGMGYDNVILNSTQTEDGVDIDLGNGNSVTLVGVNLDSLNAGDFAFG